MKLFKRRTVSKAATAVFTDHLAEFLKAGVPLLQSLELIQRELKHAHFKEILQEVIHRIRRGEGFAATLKRFPRTFSSYYSEFVEAGELSGKLDYVLERLARAIEKELDLRAKVKMTLAYPLFVLAFGIFTVVFLLIVVVPKIAVIYQDFGGDFPWATKVVLALSLGFLNFGWILGLIFTGIGIFLGVKKTAAVKKFLDEFVLSVPHIRKIVLQSEIAHFGKTLGMLLEGGVPLVRAIVLARNTVTNDIVRGKIQGIEKKVEEGKNFSETLRQCLIFPELALNLVWVGESTGKLDQSLQKLGEIAEKEVDRLTKIMTTLLEPLIILVIGLIVGFIIVSLLLPIFQMSILVR